MPAPAGDIFGTYDEALLHFSRRVPMKAERFYALQDQARQKAFTVSGVTQGRLIGEVQESIAKAIEDGEPISEWKKTIRSKLERGWKGTVADPGSRLETIYRTNVQTEFVHGRVRQMREPAITAVRPYWMFDATRDERTTDICNERHGVILLSTDPWWDPNTPPLHHRCRSGIRALRRSQAEARKRKTPDLEFEPAAEGFGRVPDYDVLVDQRPKSPNLITPLAWTTAATVLTSTVALLAYHKIDELQRQEQQFRVARESSIQAKRALLERNPDFTREDYLDLKVANAADVLELDEERRRKIRIATDTESSEFSGTLPKEQRAAITRWSDGRDQTIKRIQLGDSDEAITGDRQRAMVRVGVEESDEETREYVEQSRLFDVAVRQAIPEWLSRKVSRIGLTFKAISAMKGPSLRKIALGGRITFQGDGTHETTTDIVVAASLAKKGSQRGRFNVIFSIKNSRSGGAPIAKLSEVPEEQGVLHTADTSYKITAIRRVGASNWWMGRNSTLLGREGGEDDPDAECLGTVLIEAEEEPPKLPRRRFAPIRDDEKPAYPRRPRRVTRWVAPSEEGEPGGEPEQPKPKRRPTRTRRKPPPEE